MLSYNFVYVASIINLIANGAYIVDTLKGKTKPNRVTFLVWGLVPLIAYLAQRSDNSGPQAFFTLVIGVIPLLILLASFINKDAYWRVTTFDSICGALAVAAVALWLVTGQGVLAIILSMVADFLAALPTLIKSYKFPQTETPVAYFAETLASILVLLTVKDWRFVNYGFTAYVLILAMTFSVIFLRPRLPGLRAKLS